MLTLNTQNDKLQLVTGSAVSTDYVVVYQDTPGPPGPLNSYESVGTSDGNVATATTTDVVGAPAPRTARRVLEVTIINKHASSSQTVTLNKNVNGTSYAVTPAVTLLAGEALLYRPGTGFQTVDASGRVKSSSANTVRSPQAMVNPAFQMNDIASTVALGTGWAAASYVGKAPRSLDWATVRAKITTAVSAGASEWCQVAIATGDVNVGGNPTLTVRGFTSVEGTWNSTGLKSTVVSTTGINEGDGLWVIAGCSAPVILKVQAGLAENNQIGTFAVVSSQPSSILNTPTAFVLLAATVSAPQLSLVT